MIVTHKMKKEPDNDFNLLTLGTLSSFCAKKSINLREKENILLFGPPN